MRARIDVSEIEEKTKIRARYLRALENEEWGLLPGPAYTKSFLRAYAQALGLDGRALVEEYKAEYESPSDGERGEVVRQRSSRAWRRPRAPGPPKLSRGYVIAALGACVVIVLALVGILSHSSSKPAATRTGDRGRVHARHHHAHHAATTAGATTVTASGSSGGAVTLSLRATGRIWVCLVDQGGRKLIPGAILLPEEAKSHTFHAARFELNLGNNDVELYVNGKHQAVPASTEPIGYSIGSTGVTSLAPTRVPTCA
jgi:cytoskeletal protein RodZ